MDFFKTIGHAVTGAKDYLVEKNKKTADINRLKTNIKCQDQIMKKAYLALGRYYYHNLRDEMDPQTIEFCEQIDKAQKSREDAMSKLGVIKEQLTEKEMREEIDLDGVVEISPPVEEDFVKKDVVDDTVTDGIIDESIDTTAEVADIDENSDLPFEN